MTKENYNNAFAKSGYFIYRFRVAIVVAWVVLIAVCLPFLPHVISPFKSTGFVAENAQSTKTQAYLNRELGYDQSNRFMVIYDSKSLKATSNTFHQKIKYSLRNLNKFPIKHEVFYPKDNPAQISKDKHSAYAVIVFKSTKLLTSSELAEFKKLIRKPRAMDMEIGGKQIFVEGVNQQTQIDLYHADIVAAPITSIVLVLVFGSLIAALIPICLGGGAALIILTSLFFLGHMFELSIFTLNLALLLGLCLTLDYSLFMIARFRSEFKQRRTDNAIAVTMSTAGRAVFFSGLAVFISLSALLLFPINILFSIGTGGLAAVFFAVMAATTLLPALLSMLQDAVNWFAVRKISTRDTKTQRMWRSLAQNVVKRPWTYFTLSLVFLVTLGYSFLNVNFGISDFRIVPEKSQSRLFFDEFKEHFDENDLAPIVLVVSTEKGSILSSRNVGRLYNFTRKLEKNEHIKRVESIVNTSPRLSKSQYQRLYKPQSQKYRTKSVEKMLDLYTGKKFTFVYVTSKYSINSKETKALIKELRAMNPGRGLELQLTGTPVQNLDVMQAVKDTFPYALLWVMGLTYMILLVLLRSLFLPFKAIFMNVLSLSACYGVLVFIFQEGHLHELLNFEPQGILDITLVVIIFCATFGFSMDYEVFLLTRIQEHYKETKDNNLSIVFGIEQSNRIITSAALIVICLCGSFMVADVLMVKEFGLGIAVAIAVDAFAIRSILVPSTMALVKRWNWYLPRWLDRLLP